MPTVTTSLLSFLAGAAAFVALLHLVVALRLRQWRHGLMSAMALTIGSYQLLSGLLYDTSSAETYEVLARVQGSLNVLTTLLALWFVGFYTRVRPAVVMAVLTTLLAGALAASLVSPAGIYYARVHETTTAVLPWGEAVTLPVVTANPMHWLFIIGWMGASAYLLLALVTQYRRGERREAVVLGAALACILAPSLVDTFLHGPGPMVFPVTDLSMTAFIVVLSLGLANSAVQLPLARQSLQVSQRRAKALVDGAPDGIAIVDPESGELVEINPAGRRLLGLEDGVSPPSSFEFLRPEVQPDGRSSREEEKKWLRRARAGASLVTAWTLRRVDGSDFPVEVRLGPIQGDDGRPLVRVSFLDISDRRAAAERERELTEQLHQAQRLETLGTLAGGMAHDFRNLLTPILGHTELASVALDRDSPVQRDLAAARRSAERARDLVRQILVFSRRSEAQQGCGDLAAAVKQSTGILEAAIPSAVELDLDLGLDEGWVEADETRIQQVLVNLASNAQQAMPDGGTLTVRVEREEAPEERLGTRLVLTVADTGRGIEPELKDRLFDPFFTTKERGRGAGLGLAVVHGIVTGSGGRVEVESEVGKGAVFRVLLPEVEVPSAESPPGAPDLEPRFVLVVDGDPESLEAVDGMVSALGHRTVAANRSGRALALLRDRPGIDAVVLEWEMPDAAGPELMQRIRRSRPDLPVVCYSSVDVPDNVRSQLGAALQKPFNLAELGDALTAAVTTTRGPG